MSFTVDVLTPSELEETLRATRRDVAALDALGYSIVGGVRPVDRSLRDLERCPALETARFHKYPKAEVNRFRDATGISGDRAPDPWF